MNLNPEFQRQLYLECSPSRMLGIPLVLAVIFTFTYSLDDYQLGSATARTALVLFLLITLLWGARQSLDSIVEEYRDRTWDTQRLSALSAWQMTWGKLLGSTVMVWYAAVICLLVYALAVESSAGLSLLVFYCLAGGLLVHSSSLLLGQITVQRGQSKAGINYMLAVVGFFIIVPKLLNLEPFTTASGFSEYNQIINWYGFALNAQLFHQLSLLAALFWCVAGNYRLMMQELGIRTLPWVWLAFNLFLIVYLGGFFADSYGVGLAGYAVCGIMTYLGIMVERNDALRINRLLRHLAQRNWQRSAEETPVWCLSFVFALPFAVQLTISEPEFFSMLKLLSQDASVNSMLHFYPLAMLLIMLRDCGLYLYFSYGKNPQRALTLTLLCAVLLYGIIPGIFTVLGLSWMAALAFPVWAGSTGGALLCATLQTGLVGYLLNERWRQIA